jgi:hypothetical protein
LPVPIHLCRQKIYGEYSQFEMDASICVERLRNWSSSIHPGHLDFASPPRKTFQKVHPREAPMTMLRMLPAFLVAAFALAASPAQAEMKSQWVEYSHGDTKLKAHMVYDDKVTGRRSAVLMIHAREGMTPKTLRLAESWAKLGYVSFAADIFGYGQGVLPKDVSEIQAQTAIYTKDRALMRARTQAGFDALVKNPMVDASKVALIGYCFGGAVGVEFGATGAPLVANVRSTVRSATMRQDGRRTPKACT